MRLAHCGTRAEHQVMRHAPRDDVLRDRLQITERLLLQSIRRKRVQCAIVNRHVAVLRGVGPHRQVDLQGLGQLRLVRQDAHADMELHVAKRDAER